MFIYNVCCEFDADKQALADEWLAWLRDEHLRDVCNAGAQSARVVQMDGAPLFFEIRYEFASRAAFETYEQDHAPRLRAEGLARFSPDRGMKYQRSTGTVVQVFSPK